MRHRPGAYPGVLRALGPAGLGGLAGPGAFLVPWDGLGAANGVAVGSFRRPGTRGSPGLSWGFCGPKTLEHDDGQG